LRKRGYANRKRSRSSEQGGSVYRIVKERDAGSGGLRRWNKALSRRQAEKRLPAENSLRTELARIAALSFDDLRGLWLKMTGQGLRRGWPLGAISSPA